MKELGNTNVIVYTYHPCMSIHLPASDQCLYSMQASIIKYPYMDGRGCLSLLREYPPGRIITSVSSMTTKRQAREHKEGLLHV